MRESHAIFPPRCIARARGEARSPASPALTHRELPHAETGRLRLRRWRDPEPEQKLREITQTGALQAFAPGKPAKGLRHRRALLEVAPQLALDHERRCMRVGGATRLATHHFLPMGQLVRAAAQVVLDHLLVTVQAHGQKGGGESAAGK